MIFQYAINVKDIHLDMLKPFCGILSREKLRRIERYRFEADKVRCFVGELMLRFIVTRDYAIAQDDIGIDVSDTGKPFFTGAAAHIFFNISHSQDLVVCAVGESPVGIDVEHVRDKEANLASYVLSKYEYSQWIGLPENIRNFEFYRYWTIKESYSKFVGQGLGIQFSGITAEKADHDLWKIMQDANCIILSQKLTEKDYLAVCIEAGSENLLERQVKYLSIDDILKNTDCSQFY